MARMLRLLTTVLISVFLPIISVGGPVGGQPDSLPPPSEVKLVPVAEGLTDVTEVTHAGDSRLFVAEQAGTIRIVRDGSLLAPPFLDISSQVVCCGELGLLGLAFHPNYSSNGYFYVNYTYVTGENTLRTRVSRFRVSAEDANVADGNSEFVVLEFDQPYANHNGGSLHFGPDSYLYVATGDGGSMYDPPNNAQDTGVLLGKILRIDVNRTTGADCGSELVGRYGIPAGNPLADGYGSVCDEIWAYGLRNPWRISFDRSTGDLWIADVGQGAREEIDLQAARSAGGQNYGWDCREGTQKNTDNDPSPACSANLATIPPIHEYDHSGGKCSITGGYVYRGASYPAFRGSYFFADYCSGELWALKRTNGGVDVSKLTVPGTSLRNWSTFGEDARGELYVASPEAIYRLEDPGAAAK